MNEIWKPVPEFEERYEVSNLGRVRSIDRETVTSNGRIMRFKGKILAQFEKYGHSDIPRLQVNLCKNSRNYSKLVSRLVAKAFIPNPDGLPEVNHKDENPLNNNVENLEWCTHAYNHNYGTRNSRQAEKMKKKINMYSLNGDFIRQYNSIKEAAEDINGDASGITKVCKGKYKYHKGYLFRYA